MARSGQRIALLTLDANMLRDEEWVPFNYAIRRIQAAVAAEPELANAEIRVFEASSPDEACSISDAVMEFRPDLVGASVYLWSFPTFLEIARRVKAERPDVSIVFGGPSARAAMFDLEPFSDGAKVVDALCVRDGEEAFRDIALLEDRTPVSLLGVKGLSVSTASGWVDSPPRTSDTPLDDLPSPYQMGLIPPQVTAHIETFRGCPLSCAFCEWGVADRPSRVHSAEFLIREFEALKGLGAKGGFLVDAALNLNAKAFANLVQAENHTRYFRDTIFSCEIYPTHIRDEHLHFLSGVNIHHLGVGLQSYNGETLARIDRPFDADRFERGLAELATVTEPTCEIIMGIPGDPPASFWKTVDRLMSLPCNVLIYHCLVLPDGLMTRAPAGSDMDFDPFTLKMRSCWGWSEKDFRENRERLDRLVEDNDGDRGEFHWLLPGGGSPNGATLMNRVAEYSVAG